MIISHENRYVFVQVAHTACSALAKELCLNYGGVEIFGKHTLYDQFLKSATAEEKRYLSFASLRNPLDLAVTIYGRYRSGYDKEFFDPSRWKRNGGWISDRTLALHRLVHEEQLSFARYLQMAYQFPYDSPFSLSLQQVDFVLRYEHLEDDFSTVLARLGLAKIRPIPFSNETPGKGHFLSYYDSPGARRHAVKIFGPYLSKWGYGIPEDWEDQTVPRLDKMKFQVFDAVRRGLMWRDSKLTRMIRTLAGR